MKTNNMSTWTCWELLKEDRRWGKHPMPAEEIRLRDRAPPPKLENNRSRDHRCWRRDRYHLYDLELLHAKWGRCRKAKVSAGLDWLSVRSAGDWAEWRARAV